MDTMIEMRNEKQDTTTTLEKEVGKRKRKNCKWDVIKGNEESENVGSSSAIQRNDTSTIDCFRAIFECRSAGWKVVQGPQSNDLVEIYNSVTNDH